MMRNIRIQRGAPLNPSCAIDLGFESMLRTDTHSKPFPQPALMFAVKSSDAVSRLRLSPNASKEAIRRARQEAETEDAG
jgi:hypothetical protein